MKTTHGIIRMNSHERKQGSALLISLLLIGLLSLLAGTVYRLTKPEVASATLQRSERLAFYHAEAGVQYAIGQLSAGIRNQTLALTSAVQALNIVAPAGYQFEPIKALYKLDNGTWFSFIVTGRYEKASVVVEATVRRPKLMMDAGLFGDYDVQVQPNNVVYSYDSRVTANPTPAGSTAEANIGSNGGVTMLPGIILDGIVLLGEDLGGNPASAPPAVYTSEYVDRIDPDPLGAVNGPLHDAILYYSIPAHNNNAAAGIVNNTINLGNHDVMTLPAGHFYLTSFYLASGSRLNVLGTPANPTVIYMHGGMRTQPNCDINVTNGLPTNFLIFSDVSNEIQMQPNGDFAGFVYAPNATVTLQPGGALKGVFWARYARLQPGNHVFIDVALLDMFTSSNVKLVQWKQVFR